MLKRCQNCGTVSPHHATHCSHCTVGDMFEDVMGTEAPSAGINPATPTGHAAQCWNCGGEFGKIPPVCPICKMGQPPSQSDQQIGMNGKPASQFN